MPNINLIGTEPDQIPTNADLGTMAFQDQDYVNVGNLIVATADVTTEARFARFSTANALITGGSVTATNFSSANVAITGGNIDLAAGNITAGNIFITNPSIQNYEYNAVATKSYVDTMLIIFGT